MKIFIGANSDYRAELATAMASRHGLITGATGTGKTITLQTLAEGFSALGVPVFAADVKGDLSGLSQPGGANPKVEERRKLLNLETIPPRANPTIFWDLFAQGGHPVRTTVSEIGPVLFARILGLNDTQEQVLQVVFKIADDQQLLLIDLKDLRELLSWIGENAKELRSQYGNIATQSLGTIQRALVSISERGGEQFFGEPGLAIDQLLRVDLSGSGFVHILDARKLLHDGVLYSTFLLWMLSELFENLPEVGDLDKPKLVFFFDEAHLLFKDASPELLNRIEQVVRLIRSKGVGIFFITQYPSDIPDAVLGQLGNRIQHALRAYTPSDQKAVRAAAQSFRKNPSFDTESVISELGVGEALVSLLGADGVPGIAQRVFIAPPNSKVGAIDEPTRSTLMQRSPFFGQYEKGVDRESAYELLRARKNQQLVPPRPTSSSETSRPGRTREGVGEAMLKSFARSIGSSLGRQILRGVLGSITR